MSLFEKVFGTHSDKELKKIYPIVDKIEALDSTMQALSDEELKAKTPEFKERLEKGETLDDLLPEAFAVVREAADRVLHMKHYRVQLIGGILLHQGRIPEMRTGEGKTLVSTLPAYLNALEGKGVHIVTVNDYLAKRDAEWMGQVHEFLGLTVGVILNSDKNDARRAAYNCDITYVTNNELGFDYLRDNMVIYKEQLVQRMLCAEANIDSQRLRIGELRDEDWAMLINTADTLSSANIYIDDTAGITAMDMRSRARRLKAEHGLDLIVVDYLQLMQGSGKKNNNGDRQQEVSEISRSLKALARELDVPVIALSQLSRSVEARQVKRPMLSDLRESGSLEQDADIVAFLYREDYYNPETENKNITELIIAKHRNGPVDTVNLFFHKQYTKFVGLSKRKE